MVLQQQEGIEGVHILSYGYRQAQNTLSKNQKARTGRNDVGDPTEALLTVDLFLLQRRPVGKRVLVC